MFIYDILVHPKGICLKQSTMNYTVVAKERSVLFFHCSQNNLLYSKSG